MDKRAEFDVPRDEIVPLDGCRLTLDTAPHPFETDNLAAIEENWAQARREQPALFDGEVVLLSRLVLRNGVLEGTCHVVRFATLTYWRVHGFREGAQHIYAQAAPVGSDGALLAVRMGGHTASPGKVYFAAGTFEPEEFADGRADIEGNMAREVGEETGLDLLAARPAGRLHMLWRETGVALFRRYLFAETAGRLAERVTAFVAGEVDPEIEGPVVITSAGQRIEGIQDHMPPILDWHFSTPLPA